MAMHLSQPTLNLKEKSKYAQACDLHCTISRVTLCKRLQVVHKEVSTIFYFNLRTCPAAFVHTNLCVFGLTLRQIGMYTIFQPSCTHSPTMIFEFNTSI